MNTGTHAKIVKRDADIGVDARIVREDRHGIPSKGLPVRRKKSARSFNKTLGHRTNKDAVMSSIVRAIQSNRLDKQSIVAAVPGLTPKQFSQLRAGEIDRFSQARLEQIENCISAFLSESSICECAA